MQVVYDVKIFKILVQLLTPEVNLLRKCGADFICL